MSMRTTQETIKTALIIMIAARSSLPRARPAPASGDDEQLQCDVITGKSVNVNGICDAVTHNKTCPNLSCIACILGTICHAYLESMRTVNVNTFLFDRRAMASTNPLHNRRGRHDKSTSTTLTPNGSTSKKPASTQSATERMKILFKISSGKRKTTPTTPQSLHVEDHLLTTQIRKLWEWWSRVTSSSSSCSSVYNCSVV